jgi:hypothetical protein
MVFYDAHTVLRSVSAFGLFHTAKGLRMPCVHHGYKFDTSAIRRLAF